MGKLTRKLDPAAKGGIEPYDGEEPKPGMYRARIIKTSIRKAKNTDSLSYNVFYELEATKAEHKKYDGYSGFAVLWLGEHENLLAREASFYKAITGKAPKDVTNVNVVFEGTEADFAEPAGAEVTKIDGKTPKGRVVKVNLQIEKGSVKDAETGEKYEDRLRANDIYPAADADTAPAKSTTADLDDDEDDAPDFVKAAVADDDDDDDGDDEALEDDAEAAAALEAEIEARRKELRSRAYGLPKLKEACEAAGIYEKGMDKTALVEAILKYEFEDEDGEDAEDDDDETADDKANATPADTDSDEEDDEDDDEEDDEEDDEDEDPEAELLEELAPLDRSALKVRIKGNDESVSIKKSMTDDDLRTIIVGQELNKSPF